MPVLSDPMEDLTCRFQVLTLEESSSGNVAGAQEEDHAFQRSSNGEGDAAVPLVDAFCLHLVRQRALFYFVDSLESVLRHWSILLYETTLSGNISSTDSRFVDTLRVLDRAITTSNSRLLSRLALVQLLRVLKTLESRVAVDRQAGLIQRSHRYSNASITLDIYMSAQENNSVLSRHAFAERRHLAKRWSELAGRWPLFVLIYSEETEEIIRHPWQLSNTMLRLVARRVHGESPPQLQAICEHVETAVLGVVVQIKRPINNSEVKKLIHGCQVELR